MKWLRQTGVALILAVLLATGTDASALGEMVAAWSSHSTPDALLPACCRHHGRHKCPMIAMGGMAGMSDTQDASIHAVCNCCPEGAARAGTSTTAWMADGTMLEAHAQRQCNLSVGRRLAAQSTERRLWRDRGPPKTA